MVFLTDMLLNHIFKVLFTATFLITSVFGNGAYAVTLSADAGNNLLLPSEASSTPVLRGIKINPSNPFNFDFIVDGGKDDLNSSGFKDQVQQAIGYFLAGLAIPQKDLWVNLSPYEQNRIAPANLGLTALGNELLNQDYLLKKLAASLTYPETEVGKAYWESINNPAGANNHSPATQSFNKVWIVPDKVKIYEDNDKAFIASCRLKVMTEEEYTAYPSPTIRNSDAFRQHILPLIEKEVNEGKNFAALRQAINSLVLAIWFKGKLKDAVLNKAYANKALTKGIETDDPAAKQKIYEQYLKVFEKGVYDYIKREGVGANNYSPVQKIVKRRYFSGGVDVTRFAVMLLPWSEGVVRASGINLVKANVDVAPWGIYQRNRKERAIRIDLKQNRATRRYTDGHESFHALVDELRIAGINMRWLSVKREERLAEIFGIAFRDGRQMVPKYLLGDLKLFQDRLNNLLRALGKPTIDDLLEYLQDRDQYDYRNPATLAQILNSIGIAVSVSGAAKDELLLIHKSKKGFIRAKEQLLENYPSAADLLRFRSQGKKYRVYPSIPRIDDFGGDKPIVISANGLRGSFVEPGEASVILKKRLKKFISSQELRCKIDGIVFFKVINDTQICVAFMNTEANLARIAERFDLKIAKKELLDLSQTLPNYKKKKHVAISYQGLENIFIDPEYAAQVINNALADFMASTKLSDVIMGITFFKTMRSSVPVPVFVRTPENIALVAKKFQLKIIDPDYLDFMRTLPEFNGEQYIAFSEPGLDGIYLNPKNAAEKMNNELKDFMVSFKRNKMVDGVKFFKMRTKNNRPVLAVLKTPENVANLAKRCKFKFSPKWVDTIKKTSDGRPTNKEYVALYEEGGHIFYDHKKAIAKIKEKLADFIASTRTSYVYNGIEFIKIESAMGITIGFDRADRLKVAEAFGIMLMEDLEEVDDSVIAVSPNGCNSIFLPSNGIAVYRLIKKALADFLESPDLTCWRFGILWEKALESGHLVLIFQNNAENIRIIEMQFDTIYYSSDEVAKEQHSPIYRAAMPPKDEVGGIDVSENVVNIQTNGKFDTDSIDVNNVIAEWKNIQGVAFNIVSIKKITALTAQELFAAP